MAFWVSRALKKRINFEGGVFQFYAIVFIILTATSICFLGYYSLDIYWMQNVSTYTKIAFCLLALGLSGMLIASSVMSETDDSNLLNGLIPSVLIFKAMN